MRTCLKSLLLIAACYFAANAAENFLQDLAPYLASRAIVTFKAAAGMDPVLSPEEQRALAAYQATVDNVVAKKNALISSL